MKITPSQYATSLLAISLESKQSPAVLVQNFLRGLKRRGEIKRAKKILAALERIAQEQAGIKQVTIETARVLDKETEAGLIQKAEEMFPGKKLEVSFRQDASLIAGYRIRSATELLDQSLETTLTQLRATLNKT